VTVKIGFIPADPATLPPHPDERIHARREICQTCECIKDDRCTLITCPNAPWYRTRCPVAKWGLKRR
jgi:hypothetical protein